MPERDGYIPGVPCALDTTQPRCATSESRVPLLVSRDESQPLSRSATSLATLRSGAGDLELKRRFRG